MMTTLSRDPLVDTLAVTRVGWIRARATAALGPSAGATTTATLAFSAAEIGPTATEGCAQSAAARTGIARPTCAASIPCASTPARTTRTALPACTASTDTPSANGPDTSGGWRRGCLHKLRAPLPRAAASTRHAACRARMVQPASRCACSSMCLGTRGRHGREQAGRTSRASRRSKPAVTSPSDCCTRRRGA